MVKRAVILKAPGTNNDYETRYALEQAGAEASVVHLNRISSGEVKLEDFAMMVIPGGFSYGDQLGAGRVFSLFLKYRFREDFEKFIRKGKLVLGICNGFQVLVKSKVLPFFSDRQEATLMENDSGRFVCRWTGLKADTGQFWFSGIEGEIKLPVAHAEGKFICSREVAKKLERNGQIALKYTDNPNGSLMDIAGIVNPEGNVLGLMPHPERYIFPYQYPGNLNVSQAEVWGKKIYRNMVKNA